MKTYTADLIVDEEPFSFTFANDTSTVTDGSIVLVMADGGSFSIAGEPSSIEATIVASDPTWSATGLWSPVWGDAEADSCGCITAQAELFSDG